MIQEDAGQRAADEIGDSTMDSFVAVTEDAPETEVLQTLMLMNSTVASTLPRPDTRPPRIFGDFVVGEALENLARHSEDLSLPGSLRRPKKHLLSKLATGDAERV